MDINMDQLWQAVELLGFGWGGVFIVIFIIYLASIALTRMFPVNKDKK
ncbi:MAG: hypothetical protein LBV67_01310 [Streptococcaceae bacterium]|jgi:hypothetical protein|nr:hypothetical protein [Streptococcaceae bacterium]